MKLTFKNYKPRITEGGNKPIQFQRLTKGGKEEELSGEPNKSSLEVYNGCSNQKIIKYMY